MFASFLVDPAVIALVIAVPVALFFTVFAAHLAFPKVFARRPRHFSPKRTDIPRAVTSDPPVEHLRHRSKVLRHPLAESLARESQRLSGGDYKQPLTLNSLLLRSAALHPDRPFLGRRVGSGPYVWKTYSDAVEEIYLLGCAFRHVGLRRGDRVAIYAHNSPFWVLGASGASSGAMPTVPLYDTWSEEVALGILKTSGARALLTSRRHLGSTVRMAAKLPQIALVMLLEEDVLECDKAAVADLAASAPGVRFCAYNDAVDTGRRNPVDLERPEPGDVATICFTSGSGGTPRGAVLTHDNMCSVVASARLSGLEFNPGDVHLSYIPLAHMFERLVVSAIIAGGGAIGFYRGSVATLLDDAVELKPTIFPSVPRVWNRVHDRITAALHGRPVVAPCAPARPGGGKGLNGLGQVSEGNSLGAVISTLFSPVTRVARFVATAMARAALRAKIRAMDGDATLCAMPFVDTFFLAAARSRLGGRVRCIISGSAPIRAEVLKELGAIFSAVVVEGYGGTEYAAGGCILWPGDEAGSVGSPIACAEICLESVDHFGCHAGADRAEAEPVRGEILIRGPHVSRGFDLAQDVMPKTKDGWLRTGDVGRLNPDGTLVLIDRVKSLLKLSQGEYIAPVRVEAVLSSCPCVAQCWVDAGRTSPAILAVVILDEFTSPGWLDERGVDPKDTDAVAATLLAEFKTISASAGLNSLETVKGVIVEDPAEAFSIENGLLTASMKPIRGKLREKYGARFDALYKKLGIK